MTAFRLDLVIRITPNGEIYDNRNGRLVWRVAPGEMAKIGAGDEYTIIVHRSVGKKPAPVIKLFAEQEVAP